MEKKKITVVVPVYNVENYIEKTLKSLCTQTYQNLQILLRTPRLYGRCGQDAAGHKI